MVKDTYTGTKGLTIDVACNRLFELMDKQPLGGKDEDFYIESKEFIQENLRVLIKNAKYFENVKGLLTAKQLLKLLED